MLAVSNDNAAVLRRPRAGVSRSLPLPNHPSSPGIWGRSREGEGSGREATPARGRLRLSGCSLEVTVLERPPQAGQTRIGVPAVPLPALRSFAFRS